MYFSPISIGTWKWGEWGHHLNTKALLKLIQGCLDLGVTTFDHADIYGHYSDEAAFGNALKLNPYLRPKMQLVTKCGIQLITPRRPHHKIKSYNTSKAHIVWSVENSLQALQTDYLDLLLIHRPDPLLDPDEVAEAFFSLHQQGKVLNFGVSNFTTSQFDMLNSRIKLITNQIEFSILHLNPLTDGVLDQCLQHRIRPMVWSPLGSGRIFNEGTDEQVKRIREIAISLGKKYNQATIDQILLAWLRKHPSNIVPILGTAQLERVKAAVDSLNIHLTREEWFELWQASTGQEVA